MIHWVPRGVEHWVSPIGHLFPKAQSEQQTSQPGCICAKLSHGNNCPPTQWAGTQIEFQNDSGNGSRHSGYAVPQAVSSASAEHLPCACAARDPERHSVNVTAPLHPRTPPHRECSQTSFVPFGGRVQTRFCGAKVPTDSAETRVQPHLMDDPASLLETRPEVKDVGPDGEVSSSTPRPQKPTQIFK